MQSRNLTVLKKYIKSAKERKELYEENTQNRADYCLEEFFQKELKFTKVDKLTYKINRTDFYLKFNVNSDCFTLYITEPFLYRPLIKISGLEALGDAALELEEVINNYEK